MSTPMGMMPPLSPGDQTYGGDNQYGDYGYNAGQPTDPTQQGMYTCIYMWYIYIPIVRTLLYRSVN